MRRAAAPAGPFQATWTDGSGACSGELLACEVVHDCGGVLNGVENTIVVLCHSISRLAAANQLRRTDVGKGVAVKVIGVLSHTPSLAEAGEVDGEDAAGWVESHVSSTFHNYETVVR